MVLVYKTIKDESPDYLFSMFSAKYSYQTKQARRSMIKHTRDLDLELTADSFRWRAAKAFSDLPLVMRNLNTVQEFKKAAKPWIKENIPFASLG